MGPESESEFDRWLSIAEKLLAACDLIGSRRFAERALEFDPLTPSDRADRIIAVADVLLASQFRAANGRPDPHSVLSSSAGSDPSAVLSSYRRLSFLLNPNSNFLPFAGQALRYVSDAYSALSHPGRRSPSAPGSEADAGADGTRFWTTCGSCCHVHLYDRIYAGRDLRCRNCGKGFRADRLSGAPPVVEGTDMYYCTWGYFPLGLDGLAAAPAGAAGRAKQTAPPVKQRVGLDINREVEDDDSDDDSEPPEYVPQAKRRRGGEVLLSSTLERIVDVLRDARDISFLFLKPVTKKEAPDYLDIVERPMDLFTIRDKVRRMEYRNPEEFRHDVWQIAHNAHLYNDERNPEIPPLADRLLELCDRQLAENKDKLTQ
ncbi:uncharacterized protein M6B38_419405 [Iris pallida]|uniref:Bromo domain-containing protein n=1 Tax=Iris pallida TaxID=29817 RepID=A0AAX6FI08_IRIPA|nr:uncharacterized protein M6B38_419405 [Iris pallida]